MKKLMIAAAIVCAAAFAQAAQFQWVAFGIVGPDEDTPYTGSASLTLWDTTAGTSDSSFGATMTEGFINTYIGDGSAGDAGFIVIGHDYDAQFTMVAADGSVFTSEKITGITGMHPIENQLMFTSGSWAAPEPTSGLLLLIGVAGLALKRKRA